MRTSRPARSVAALVLTLALPGWSATGGAVLAAAAAENPGWVETTTPLPAVHSATAHWDGRRFVVFGGDQEIAYGPAVDQDYYRPPRYSAEAATFDPSTGAWGRIADLPSAPGRDPDVATSDGLTYVLTRPPSLGAARALLAYDPARDAWDRLAVPPGQRPRLVGGGPQLAAVDQDGRRHALLDPDTGRWKMLTPDPFRRAGNRAGVWVGSRLVLSATRTAQDLAQHGDPPPYIRLAAIDHPGRPKTAWEKIASTRLTAAANRPVLVGDSLVWAEHGRLRTKPPARLGGTFDLQSGQADGIPDTVGRAGSYLPDGMRLTGGVTLNGGRYRPATGAWADLPPAPNLEWLYPAYAGGSRYVLSFGGAPTRELQLPLNNGRAPSNDAYLLTLRK